MASANSTAGLTAELTAELRAEPLPATTPAASAPATLTPRYGERAIAEAQLICFENPRPGRPYEVTIELPDFTCTCPFSGYPDFAVLRLPSSST